MLRKTNYVVCCWTCQFKQRNETFGLCVLVVRVAHPHADEVVQMGQTYLRSSRIFWRIIKILHSGFGTTKSSAHFPIVKYDPLKCTVLFNRCCASKTGESEVVGWLASEVLRKAAGHIDVFAYVGKGAGNYLSFCSF